MDDRSQGILPARVRLARISLGMSQEIFARALGCSRRTVAGWETGEHQPTVRLIPALAEVTGRPVEFFFQEEVA